MPLMPVAVVTRSDIGRELAYAQFTSPVTVDAVSSAAPNNPHRIKVSVEAL